MHKQLDLAMAGYLNDYDEYYPTNGYGFNGRIVWDDNLAGYDGRESFTEAKKLEPHFPKSTYGEQFGEVYRCPSDKTKWEYDVADYNTLGRTYSITNLGYGDAIGETGGYLDNCGVSGKSNGGTLRTRRLAQIKHTSQTIVLTERPANQGTGSNNLLGNPWAPSVKARDVQALFLNGKLLHQNARISTYLMADGHVEALEFMSTLTKISWQYE